jgi:hypothetical protein
MNNISNPVAFLRTSRTFPSNDASQLSVEIDRAYVDIANSVNSRTIGLFPVNVPAITGEEYFLVSNQKQQTLRRVYTFTSTASITHGISVYNSNQWTSCFGSYTDGTNGYGLIWGTNGAIPNQISFYLTSTQIVFVVDAGAPALTSGRIILTWLSSP